MSQQEEKTTAVTQGTSDLAADGDVFVFPASFGQRRLWFLDRFEPGSPYYNIPLAFRLRGRFDPVVFRRAVQMIVERHEALRTTIREYQGEPVQVIDPHGIAHFTEEDVFSVPVEGRDAEVRSRAIAEARTPFDLARGPLFRTRLIHVTQDDTVVLMTLHHCIADGWSMAVLMQEIVALYAACSQAQPCPLPSLPIQYADYSEWQHSWLRGETRAEQIAYWTDTLRNAPEVLELPTDRPRPAVYSNVGASYACVLPARVNSGVHRLCRQEGVTVFMVLFAAFSVLLHRYTGQKDLCLGTPIANRTHAETEGLIGLFINTIVLRTRFDDDPSFLELVRRVRGTTLGAYAHQDLPFEMLLDALHLDRTMTHPPLFQVMFILQNVPSRIRQLPGLTLEQLDVDMGTSTYELTLMVSESEAGFLLTFEYNTDLFDEPTIRRMGCHMEELLASAIADPAAPVSSLAYVGHEECETLTMRWNPPPVARGDRRVYELFAERAARAPDTIAVVDGGRRCTYGLLNARANWLAHELRRRGIGPEGRVGIALGKSVDLIVAVLGVMKAGAAYVPLDPSYPSDRLDHMVRDARMDAVITREDILPQLPPVTCGVLHVSIIPAFPAGGEAEDPVVTGTPDNLAYLIYTSGTTGVPKGTMVSHRSLMYAYHGWEDRYELLTSARVHLQMAGFSFDVFSGDLVRALCSGGTLVLCPREIILDAEQLYHVMVREGVTIAEFVPAVLRNLLDWCETEQRALDQLRILIAGSDIWYVREYEHIRTMLGPSARLINSYGVTEATIDTTLFERSGRTGLAPERCVPIGRPFPDQSVHILDGRMRPSGIGIPGELYIGGPGVARGYNGMAGSTAARFVPDPVSGQTGARLYRTGDIGRFLPDGTIEFMGRADHQVKIRGFRIEPGDIEASLVRHPAVRDAVITVRDGPSGSKSLVAYVIPQDGAEVDGTVLRRFLAEHLPEYMIPSAFVVRDTFPLTPNGKVDRTGLPPPGDADRIQAAGHVPPSTPQEEKIAGIWRELLGIERIGVYDDFFQLGGHSLLATQLVARLRATFGYECPLRTVFETPTIAGLATALGGMERRTRDTGAQLIRVPRTGRIPLSFAQQRMWFLQHLEPDSPFYVIPEVYRITGALEAEVLRGALQMVVRRHEILRTVIREEEGVPWQEVLPSLTVDLPVIDLSALPAAEQETAITRTVQEESMRPLRLDTPPLFRMHLIRLAPDRHVLLTVFHHCISDNWSTGVFLGDLSTCYESYRRGVSDPLPPLSVQYADYAVWQRATLQGDVLAGEITYWKEKLTGIPRCLELPTDRPRPAVQTFSGAVAGFTLPQPIARRLRVIAQDENATMFMLLLTAFDILLYRYTGQQVLAVGTPVANRGAAELEALIGLFVNTLVIRADLDGNPTFRTMLHRIRTNALEAYAHQEVPFEKLVDALQPERDLARSPLFQVMFVLQNARAQRPPVAPIAIEPMDAHSGTSKFDLTLFMAEQGDDWGGIFEYNTDLFDRGTIERMMRHFVHLLDAIGADPDRPVGHLPLLGPREQRTLLYQGRGARRVLPEHPYVHDFIEARSFLCPDRSAVEGTEGVLTYKDLRSRSNTLAHRLHASGVGPESCVGVFLPRSHDLIVAVLGTLKAGGAYVPIDYAFPDERIGLLVKDAAPVVVLTSRAYAPRLQRTGVPLLLLDETVDQRWEEAPTGIPMHPDNLAYVIYTSGSTGVPKGTLLTHRGLMNYVEWCLDTYPCEDKRTLLHLPLTFDASITALFPPLVAGGTIVLADDGAERTMPLDNLVRNRDQFGFIKLTPAHLEILTHTLPPDTMNGLAEAYVVGGEQFTADQAAPWFASGKGPVFYNEYGPTEAVVGCVVARIDAPVPGAGGLPIGRAIPNVSVYVLDEHLHPVPAGVWGELCIAGVGLARGYLNRADLTAAGFVPDPFGRPGDRMYRTGDLVRFLPGGALEFRGRRDAQVKFHGYRIEPGEIEAVLRSHPLVQDAVVCVKANAAGEARLVAYYSSSARRETESDQLREHLARQLPPYMLPSVFVHLDRIPLTVHGKIDRAALPQPGEVRAGSVPPSAAPQSATEVRLARIWSEVLGVDNPGIDDNFFALGGDSILIIQVLARAAQAGIMLSAAQMFQHPTVREQAAIAAVGLTAGAEEGMLEGEVPVMPIQQWFFELGLAEPSHWNQSLMIPLDDRLDPEECRSMVRALMEHHDVLRMRFSRDADGWHQRMTGEVGDIPMVEEDLTSSGGAMDLAELLAERSTRWQRSLDITHGPVLRVVLYHTIRGDRLLIVIHHLVVDVVSWTVLLEDLRAMYAQVREGKPVVLPPRPTSYRQWASHLRRFTQLSIPPDEVAYWTSVAASTPTQVFTFSGSGSFTEKGTAVQECSFDVHETHRILHEIPVKTGVDVPQVLLALLVYVLSRQAGDIPVWIDLESHGRNACTDGLSADRTVGWFTVMYPLLLTVGADGTSLDAVRDVSEQIARVPGQGRGFGLLRTWSPSQAVQAALRALPPAQVVFNYLGQTAGEDAGEHGEDPDRMKGEERGGANVRTHILEVSARIAAGRLRMVWNFAREAVDAGTIRILTDAYVAALYELIGAVRGMDINGGAAERDFGWSPDDVRAITSQVRRSRMGDDDADE